MDNRAFMEKTRQGLLNLINELEWHATKATGAIKEQAARALPKQREILRQVEEVLNR